MRLIIKKIRFCSGWQSLLTRALFHKGEEKINSELLCALRLDDLMPPGAGIYAPCPCKVLRDLRNRFGVMRLANLQQLLMAMLQVMIDADERSAVSWSFFTGQRSKPVPTLPPLVRGEED
jgi:hypothetical protein